jgi:Universal stress protein family
MGGWGIIVAGILVMANLAQIACKYTFLLINAEGLAENVFWVTFLGCLFIAVLTWVCYVARPAEGLLGLAEEHQARMIVIGTHSERPLMGVVLGSTPYKLLHRSPVPVLVVPSPDV